ncbi:MAG: hypothetical protein BA863_05560 [Desulfovibrio sp. S3730MH75]|nr:MAG: hypothetical protein BA863_05560 [Desulfovibrio sp. S3730MH75]
MSESFATLAYEDREQQVCWQGYTLSDNDVFDSFMKEDVAARLNDEEGSSEFESHLRGLSLTEFGKDSLEAVLKAGTPEENDWAVGEALAETWLSQEHEVIWPWNMERDKRNANASLPGADLVGFVVNGTDTRLVMGEVKSSAQDQYPPNVLYGRSGMINQIDRLANDLGTIQTLLSWLLHRCKNTEFETYYNASAILYFDSGNKAVSLFGVLIRDTEANELDLKNRGKALGSSLNTPTSCHLIALHLPCKIAELPERVKGGDAS